MTCLDSARRFIRLGHIPLLVFLQIFFIILFAAFVEYDPISAVYNKTLETDHTLNAEVKFLYIFTLWYRLLNQTKYF